MRSGVKKKKLHQNIVKHELFKEICVINFYRELSIKKFKLFFMAILAKIHEQKSKLTNPCYKTRNLI